MTKIIDTMTEQCHEEEAREEAGESRRSYGEAS